jgi:hypothetical protein
VKHDIDSWMMYRHKTIQKAEFKEDALFLTFDNQECIRIFDDGQSCCEHRYMTSDDDPQELVGKMLTNIECVEAPTQKDDFDDHETQFLRVHAEDGLFVACTHNEHNGYYGGFWVKIEELK